MTCSFAVLQKPAWLGRGEELREVLNETIESKCDAMGTMQIIHGVNGQHDRQISPKLNFVASDTKFHDVTTLNHFS